jgi:uncharacterized glyoxalase superfamily protein PhnB
MRIANAQVWVHDHDVALDFYVNKLGMVVRTDVTVAEWNFRWLTVGPPEQEDVSLVLMAIPGPPDTDKSTSAEIANLVAKGFAGTLFLTTDDCRGDYQKLLALGVEFTSEPTDQMYGIEAGMRDPFGNSIRLTQLAENPDQSATRECH